MEKKTIHILATSDIHGQVFPHAYHNQQPSQQGLLKAASYIKRKRKEDGTFLLIDNGDLIQGTPLTYHFARKQSHLINPMIIALNYLAYDAAVIGNHEFNYGRELLDRTVDASHFPWLSANIVSEETGRPAFGKPYIVKELEGIKVAVLGVTTHYIPNWEEPAHIKGLSFSDAYETVRSWIAHLKRNETFDVLVVAYHGGFERDLEKGDPTEPLTGENQGYEMCMNLADIDVLITGHQHRQIAEKLNSTAVVQPGNNGKYLADVKLEFIKTGEKWRITKNTPSLVMIGEEHPDEELGNLLLPYEQAAQSWLDKEIGTIDGCMLLSDLFQARLKEHPFVEFVNKVQMEAADTDISLTSLFSSEGGGFSERVTMRDIAANYVYPNTLKVLSISGADMKAALEKSAEYFQLDENRNYQVNSAFTDPKPQHYNYDMWEGISYVLDISKPHGERVVDLSYHEQPVDLNKDYAVVMNNYRAGGGGNYHMFKDSKVLKEIPVDMSELIADYFIRNGRVRASINENWKIIGGHS
ncbi:bifunctional metallophosphatase/5'-nucleotidase [Bacillus lacus]|uniref:Bifunctional metallophosphatase/5'-nucleotidase n=1 Tax=Metabacillus lacus TaxID=1983721 RepID=A0A7X2J3A4_9BACI|nr:bifunctional UDP-sugar hydrolase/5'-nucleotidase [Metabacillus lacus]MRX73858.1 bifunctional metallophosphatase/5'-nucleotidase [Metabacillus lacus]